MDRRSWPWKKKSSDKAAAEKAAASSETSDTRVTRNSEDSRGTNYHSSPILQRVGPESSIDELNSPSSQSDMEGSFMRSPIRAKHKSTKPSSPTPEKHGRGLSRFFSSK